jgi:hypothetical protein
MKLTLIEPNSPEWDFMWEWLAKHPLNKDIAEPTVALNGDQAWQYMGSYKQKDKVIHSFRHRNHPATNSIQTISVNASQGLTDDQIHKIINI